jgi:hypothetical protein
VLVKEPEAKLKVANKGAAAVAAIEAAMNESKA